MKRQNKREYISYSSVEQMPDAKGSVLFINDSSKVFKDDVDISPVGRTLFHATLGMLDEDALQLVGDEAGVAPRLRVAHLIGCRQHAFVLLPSLMGEMVLVFPNAATAQSETQIKGVARKGTPFINLK